MTFDPLPRDAQGRWLWTPSAVERLRRAKALVAEGRAVSIQAALDTDETSDQDVQDVVLHDPSTEALRRLSEALNTIAQLEQSNQQLLQSNRQLEQKVSALLERLEQSDPNNDELRRMNSYLMTELEGARGVGTPERPQVSQEDVLPKYEYPGDRTRAADGLFVRVARWLERRLGRVCEK